MSPEDEKYYKKIIDEDLCRCGHPRRMHEETGCRQVITKIELESQELGLCKCTGFMKMDSNTRRILAFERGANHGLRA